MRHLAAGVPDEDVNGLANAGMVQLFSWSSATPVPTEEVKQDIPEARWSRIPGKLEAADRIGAAVGFGRNLGGCSGGFIQIAIGVPGEDIGSSQIDAGIVAVFTPPPGASCTRAVEQGGNLSPAIPKKPTALGPRWHSGGTATTTLAGVIAYSSVFHARTLAQLSTPALFSRCPLATPRTSPLLALRSPRLAIAAAP